MIARTCYTFGFAVTLIFLTCVSTTCGSEKEVVLIHSYPKDDDFNYVELTCKELSVNASSYDVCTEQTVFYVNQTDIRRVLNVSVCSNETITFTFSQNDEGEFACSLNGIISNTIALAAEPGILNQTSREHQVLLQTPDGQVPTILQCDIQPGLLRQRYSARWYQFSNNTRSDVLFNPMLNFNLMLNVTRAMNRSRYQCEVTINHNGSLNRTYPGAIITLNVDILGEDNASNNTQIHSGIIASIILSMLVIIIVASLLIGLYCCKMKRKRSSIACPTLRFKWFWLTDNPHLFRSNVLQRNILYCNTNTTDNLPQTFDNFSVNSNSTWECSLSEDGYANADSTTTCEKNSREDMRKHHDTCNCNGDLSLQSSSNTLLESNIPTIHEEANATGTYDCGLPKHQDSRWKFETGSINASSSNNPTENDFAFPHEHSASQLSTEMCFDQDYYSGYYGCLPDQYHAYSPSQISTYGVGSPIGILDSHMHERESCSQKVTDLSLQQNPYGHKEKRKRKKKPITLDKRTDDSGIGPSLSPVRSLSPPKQYVSLTQGPPFTHMSTMQSLHYSDFEMDRVARQTKCHRIPTNPTGMITKHKRRADITTKVQSTSVYCENENDIPRVIHTLPKRKKRSTLKQSTIGCSLKHEQVDIVPECIRPTATLQNCTSAGVHFNDEAHGFTLKIRKGSIPDGEKLTIDIGVALYGPFLYPEGFRPTSPVFWLCVRGHKSYKFRKPVEVTMQHFLSIDSTDDVTLTGLSFAKAGHDVNPQGKCSFSILTEAQYFETGLHHGSLLSKHFCYLCIVGKINELTLLKSNFCLFGTLPNTFVYDKPMHVFFFVTYFLATCLETVRKQIMTIPELAHCEYTEKKIDFHFLEGESSPAIAIQLPSTQMLPGGWQLGIEFKKKITLHDIDFMARESNDLLLKEKEGLYPPHFRVVIDGTHTFEKATAHITFSGTASDLVFDIHLIPPTPNKGIGVMSLSQVSPHTQSEAYSSTGFASTDLPPVTLPDLLNLVVTRIPSKWRSFAIMLELPNLDFDTYPIHDAKECFVRVLSEWKKIGQPQYSWDTILNILEMPFMSEQSLAMEVKSKLTLKRYFSTSFYPPLSCPPTSIGAVDLPVT